MALSITKVAPASTSALKQELLVAKVSGGEAHGLINVAVINNGVEVRSAIVTLDESGEATVNYQLPVAGSYALKAFLGAEEVSTVTVTVAE